MRRLVAAIVVVVVALSGAGCGASHPHPVLEHQHEEAKIASLCLYPRSEAVAAGADALETYELACGR